MSLISGYGERFNDAHEKRRFPFDWGRLSAEEHQSMMLILGGEREPDEVLAPEGFPYLYRWWVINTPDAKVYLHVQVANDWRVPHDHPWDNFSVYLSDGQREIFYEKSGQRVGLPVIYYDHKQGETQARRGGELHRLELLPGHDHSITLFSTGRKYREWGFQDGAEWTHNSKMVRDYEGVSYGAKA